MLLSHPLFIFVAACSTNAVSRLRPFIVVIRTCNVKVVQFAFIKIRCLHISLLSLSEQLSVRFTKEAVVTCSPASVPPHVESPSTCQYYNDNQSHLARLVIRCPLRLFELLSFFLFGSRTIWVTANTGLNPFLTINTRVSGLATNTCDINTNKTVEHVSRSPWVVKRDHM